MDAAIRIHDLTKHFRGVTALDGVTFDVPQGSLFGLLGPNGAGKTTLFSIAAGFLNPTSGRIEVLGIDSHHVSDLKGKVSMLPQDAAFQAAVPVLDQLVMFGRLMGFSFEQAEAEFQDLDIDSVAATTDEKSTITAVAAAPLKNEVVATSAVDNTVVD